MWSFKTNYIFLLSTELCGNPEVLRAGKDLESTEKCFSSLFSRIRLRSLWKWKDAWVSSQTCCLRIFRGVGHFLYFLSDSVDALWILLRSLMFKSRNLSDLTEETEACNTDFPVVLWLVNDRAHIQCRQSRWTSASAVHRPHPSYLSRRNVSENLRRGPAYCLIGEIKKSFATVLWNMDQIWVRSINLTSH